MPKLKKPRYRFEEEDEDVVVDVRGESVRSRRARVKDDFLLWISLVSGAVYVFLAVMGGVIHEGGGVARGMLIPAMVTAFMFVMTATRYIFAQIPRFNNADAGDDYGWGGVGQLLIAHMIFIAACSSLCWMLWAIAPGKHFDGVDSASESWYVVAAMLAFAFSVATGTGYTDVTTKNALSSTLASATAYSSLAIVVSLLAYGVAAANDWQRKHRAQDDDQVWK